MARRVIVVDDTDSRFGDPRYANGRLLDDDTSHDPEGEANDYGALEDEEESGDHFWHGGGWRDFPVAKPRLPANGIRAASQRGAIGTQWWSRRFLAAIESPQTSGRLTRGRSYARSGQVLSLTVMPGTVTSRVQGSRRRPYDVVLSVPVFREADWKRIIPALAGQAVFTAALLTGQLPPDMDETLQKLGLPLFPTSRQLKMECSCPDWGNPCKHAAAVCFLLAEQFDADPFTMLALRGMDRPQLLAAISAQRLSDAEIGTAEATDGVDELNGFWDAGPLPPLPPLAGTAVAGALERLGPAGITVRGRDLAELLAPAYEALTRRPEQ
jgi:uncharacterized Zn finger protein